MDYGPVVFPVSGFPRKNLGVDCVIICIIFDHCLILFLLHKEGKELGLVNFIPLNWCPVVASFPNNIYIYIIDYEILEL